MKIRSVLVGALLAVAAVPLATSPAVAADWAPYAQAAAVVNADGTTVALKNVTQVKRVGPGDYCVTVAPEIDVTKSVVHVTPKSGGMIANPQTAKSAMCPAANSVTVLAYASNDFRRLDTPFSFSIA
ncbi:hypothetical protein [Streptomyces xanthophaeus]|uniref:hypothetical protein n=1 Tax=Streptomyces TaxID=1883 RepID=UPI00233EC6E1|nr:hypothetical protein [Streptomyces xanthophaeus]WCD91042.1 hypothetical protein KPP03845_200003 [Streptomyces xanthophaeus]